MTEVTMHATPRWREVVLEQIRTVGLNLRREALVVVVALAVSTLVIGRETVRGGPGFDTSGPLQTALFSFLFPFVVWRGERLFGPAFLWTLPVERRRLALAKVLAGLVWMMTALAAFALWLLGVATMAGAQPAQQMARIPLIATIAAYLFGSALVLGLRHPLRWLLGATGVFFLLGILSDVVTQPNDAEWQYVPGATVFFATVQRAAANWQTLPDLMQLAITTLLWLGAASIALWAATSRHKETR